MRTRSMAMKMAALATLMSAPLSLATDFPGFSMEFVDIGDAGNADDNEGFGGVGYDYRIGVHEVSERMIEAYNTANPGLLISKQTRGLDYPATSVIWNEAARFVNWLNTSHGHAVAYQFDTEGANDHIALWEEADAGYDANNRYRNSNAHYFLPTEDEWYKAAYYDPNTSTYNDYATGSDTAPTAVSGGTAAGTAVYIGQPGPAEITNAGGLSPYGTMAQGGNVWEWAESAFSAPNDSVTEWRMRRGGNWESPADFMQSWARYGVNPHYYVEGFRVAAVAETDEPFVGTAIAIGENGRVSFTFEAKPDTDYAVMISPDLINWTELSGDESSETGSVTYTDTTTPPGAPKLYYRAEER